MTVQSVDTHLLLIVNRGMANPVFDVVMSALSQHGYLLVIPVLVLMFVRASIRSGQGKKGYSAALAAFLIACIAVYFGGLTEAWLKTAIGRVRPCRALDGVRLVLPCPKSYSMPSGHAISSFAFASSLFYLTRNRLSVQWRIYLLVLASLIAFSRVYLGVHYPGDVVVGSVLGAAIGVAFSAGYQKVTANTSEHKNS